MLYCAVQCLGVVGVVAQLLWVEIPKSEGHCGAGAVSQLCAEVWKTMVSTAARSHDWR